MVLREFAHSVPQGCFLREWCSPFARGMAKQRRSALQVALAMFAPQPNRQMKATATRPALMQASLLVTQRVSQEANSRVILRVLLQAQSRVKVMSRAQPTATPPGPQD
jgi:hypothetical protein